MYPKPNNIFGNRCFLENSYRKQVKRIASSVKSDFILAKSPNTIRFCSYNIKYFNFDDDANILIYNLLTDLNIDAFSLIEYHILEDSNIKLMGDSVMFEQKKFYGISTHFNLNNKQMSHQMTCDSPKINGLNNVSSYTSTELRGFTHLRIHLYTKDINIITIHLDVSDESGESRIHEIKQIHEFIISQALSNVIIIGDFNEWDIKHNEPEYEPTLMEFQERTGLEEFSTKSHDFLKSNNFVNIFHLLNKYPKFSCWSGKLVDFCYKYTPTWNNSLKIKNINFIYVDYSDHLPIILDIVY